MAISFAAALGPHPEALRLRAMRAEVLAGNVANADTPNYKARDLDFKSVLAETGSDGGVVLRTTHPGHRRGARADDRPTSVYRTPLAASVDGNSVDTHIEQAAFAENNLQFLASLRFLSGKFRSLTNALRGE